MSEWISVKDRLPEYMCGVIVYIESLCGKNFIDKDIFVNNVFHYQEDNPYINVTHWMPLPEPPKEPSNG